MRAARVPPPADLEVRLGAEFGRLLNVSATGALVRTRVPFLAGRQCPLYLNLSDSSAAAIVRIVRTHAVRVALPGATSELQEYHVAVMFTNLEAAAKGILEDLCGSAFTRTE